jgi:hypothetical protein
LSAKVISQATASWRMMARVRAAARSCAPPDSAGDVLAVTEHGSRRVRVPGATGHPARPRAVRQARNLLTGLEDARTRVRFVLHDGDASFTQAVDAVVQGAGVRIVVPRVALPVPGEPLPPPSRWQYLTPPPAAGAGDLMRSLPGVRPLPLTPEDMLTHGVLLIGMVPEVLRGVQEHAWKMLTGAATPEERGVPAVPSRLPLPLQRLRPPSTAGRASRAVGRLLEFGGVGPDSFTAIFSLPVMKGFAPRMLADGGFTFPRLVKDLGLLSGTGDVTVSLGFYNAVPGRWHHGRLAGETVRRAALQSGQSSPTTSRSGYRPRGRRDSAAGHRRRRRPGSGGPRSLAAAQCAGARPGHQGLHALAPGLYRHQDPGRAGALRRVLRL